MHELSNSAKSKTLVVNQAKGGPTQGLPLLCLLALQLKIASFVFLTAKEISSRFE